MTLDISYKEPLMGFYLLGAISGLIFALCIYVAGGSYFAGESLKIVFWHVLLTLTSFAGLIGSLVIIFMWFGVEKRIIFNESTFSFYPSLFSRSYEVVPLSDISDARIETVRNSGVSVLKMTVKRKVFTITENCCSEEDFSKLCNCFVKVSFRCKACQSTKVNWRGNTGHCYNCETISPRNSDEFDWADAYQA